MHSLSRIRQNTIRDLFADHDEVFVKIAKVTITAAEQAVGTEALEECVEYEESEKTRARRAWNCA
ncbi:hypothetical protein DSECCO2_562660 [anaerobic digester metagenome]|nr:hypothetical protein [Methanoculleus sp.]